MAGTTDDQALLAAIQDGSRDALTDLFDEFHRWLYTVGMTALRDPAGAEEATGQVLEFVARSRLVGASRLLSVMAAITYRACVTGDTGRIDDAGLDDVEPAADGSPPLYDTLWRALGGLTVNERVLFALEDLYRHVPADLAEVVGGPEPYVVVEAARRRTRAVVLAALGQGPPDRSMAKLAGMLPVFVPPDDVHERLLARMERAADLGRGSTVVDVPASGPSHGPARWSQSMGPARRTRPGAAGPAPTPPPAATPQAAATPTPAAAPPPVPVPPIHPPSVPVPGRRPRSSLAGILALVAAVLVLLVGVGGFAAHGVLRPDAERSASGRTEAADRGTAPDQVAGTPERSRPAAASGPRSGALAQAGGTTSPSPGAPAGQRSNGVSQAPKDGRPAPSGQPPPPGTEPDQPGGDPLRAIEDLDIVSPEDDDDYQANTGVRLSIELPPGFDPALLRTSLTWTRQMADPDTNNDVFTRLGTGQDLMVRALAGPDCKTRQWFIARLQYADGQSTSDSIRIYARSC